MDTDHLNTLDADKDYAVPESRVKNAGGIRARISEMKQADTNGDDSRSARRRRIQGIIDGNRPFSQQRLKDLGQGERTNLNVREGEGMADAAKTPYYSLIFRVPRFLNIFCRYGNQAQRNSEWSEVISNEFHAMLDNWEEYDYGTQLYQWQMCVFGVGLPVWADETNPFWESRKIGEVLVPDKTKSNIAKLNEAVILRPISPIDLFQLIKNEKAATTRGWKVDRVKQAIVKASPENIQSKWGPQWGEEYQASLRRGDVMWNNTESTISIADYLVKEFSGKVTHCIVLDDGGGNDNAAGKPTNILDEDDDGLLFCKIERFDCFSQVICPFFFDIGTGEWHSVKGLGPKIRDFCDVSNRLVSGMLDGARNGSAIILESADGQTKQDTQLVHIHAGIVLVEPGLKVVQNRLSDAMRGPIEVRREMQNILQSNTGHYTQRVAGENYEPTLGQAQLNYQTQGQLSDASRDRYMKTLDRLYKEMVRRTFILGKKLHGRRSTSEVPDEATGQKNKKLTWYEQLVSDFYECCIEKGVPEEALDYKNVISVKATRGIGNGSPVSMGTAIQQMMQILPMVNEVGRNHILRLYSAYWVGQGNADQIVPPFGQGSVPGSDEWAATMENIAFNQTKQVVIIVTPEQDHFIHFSIHYQGGMESVEGLKAGTMDPTSTLQFLHNDGPHMKAHLDNLMGDPTRKDSVGAMMQGWHMLSKIADQLQQQIEEAAKAQAAQQPVQQPQVDPQFLLDLKRLEGEMQIKKMKMLGDLQLKAEKQKATLRMKDVSTAHGMRIETAKATSVEPALSTAA